jgi:hypothetical protein
MQITTGKEKHFSLSKRGKLLLFFLIGVVRFKRGYFKKSAEKMWWGNNRNSITFPVPNSFFQV